MGSSPRVDYEALFTPAPLAPYVRVVRRRRYPLRPSALWARLDDPRDWAPLLATPGAADVKRVKLLDASAPAPGVEMQVLRSDHSWTRYRIDRWEPRRQVRLVALETGQGQETGQQVAGRLVERLILIPQASDTEAEWTIDHRGALLSRLVAAPGAEAWRETLDSRLDALAALAGVPLDVSSPGGRRSEGQD